MTDMHDGEQQITPDMLDGRCLGGCCGHHEDYKGRRWHRCTLWIGICLCGSNAISEGHQ